MPKKENIKWYLLFIVVLGAALRIPSVLNGLPEFVHIDERAVNDIILNLSIHDLNPHDFVYPGLLYYISFPIFVIAKVLFLSQIMNALNLDSYFSFMFIGRVLTAIFGVSSILLFYAIGKKLFNSYLGLIAALLLAIDPMNIAWSFVFKPDTLMIFLILASFFFICRIFENKKLLNSDYMWVGIFIGLATATRYNAILMIAPFLWAHYLVLKNKADFINKNFLVTVFSTLFVFFIFNPFILFDLVKFIDTVKSEVGILTGGFPWNPLAARQGWFHYPLVLNNVLGLGVVILSIGGLILSLWRHSKKDVLILIFPVIYYVIMGTSKNSQAHYILPIFPFILLLAAQFLKVLIEFIFKIRLSRIIKSGIIGLFVLVLLLPTFYNSVYYIRWINQKDPRILARNWVKNNVLPANRILIDGFGARFSFLYLEMEPPCDVQVIQRKIDYQSLLTQGKFDFVIINQTKNRHKQIQPLYDFIDKNFLLIEQFETSISRPATSFMYSQFNHPVVRIYDARRRKN